MALSPQAPQLSWEEIVAYTFLAEFDLLRDTRQDIREKPWANPANRQLRDEFFKQERAREEIQRLNIEIRRVISYMNDEEHFLTMQEELATNELPELAHQISLYREERGRFNARHKRRFGELSLLPQFSGDLSLSTAIHKYGPHGNTHSTDTRSVTPRPLLNEDDSDDDDFDDENIAEDIALAILSVSED